MKHIEGNEVNRYIRTTRIPSWYLEVTDLQVLLYVCARFESLMIGAARNDGYWTLVLGFAGSSTLTRDTRN